MTRWSNLAPLSSASFHPNGRPAHAPWIHPAMSHKTPAPFCSPLALLLRTQTAAKRQGSGVAGDANSPADHGNKWGRRGSKTAERDEFRVQQQGFYVRGDLIVDVFQARGLRPGTAGERWVSHVQLFDLSRRGQGGWGSRERATDC